MADLYWERAVTAVTAHVRTHQINIVATEWQQFVNDLHMLSDALVKLASITLDGGTEGQPGPDAWEGDAADAYRVYLDMLVTAVNDLRGRSEVVHHSISDCMGHAATAVGAIPVPVTDGAFGLRLPAGMKVRPMDIEDGNEIAKTVSADRRNDSRFYDEKGGFGEAMTNHALMMLQEREGVVADGEMRRQTADGVAQWWTSNNAHASYAYGKLIGAYEGELPRCVLDRATAELPPAQQDGGGGGGGGGGAGAGGGAGGGVPGGGSFAPGSASLPSGSDYGSLQGDGGLDGLRAAAADPSFSSSSGTGRAPTSPPYGMVSPGGTAVGRSLAPKPPLTSYGKAVADGQVKGASGRGAGAAMAGTGAGGAKNGGGEKPALHSTYLVEDADVWAAEASPDGPLGKAAGYRDPGEA